MIAQASKDERGRYAAGKAGDQTGKEVWLAPWYSRPWDTVIRAKDRTVARKISYDMKAACDNPHIGYDQWQRNALLYAAEDVGYDCARVAKNVETDCSALVTVACIYAGVKKSLLYRDGNSAVTWNLEERLRASGLFTVLKESKYLIGAQHLKDGDILLNTKHHVGVWVMDSTPEPEKPAPQKIDYAERYDKNIAGTYEVTASLGLNLRAGAGTNKELITTMRKGTQVRCYGYYTERGGYKWLSVMLPTGIAGFAISTYMRRC